MSEVTLANVFKEAMIAAAVELWDAEEVQVTNGHPGMTEMDDLVVFTEIQSAQVPGPQGGRRIRDETLTLTVIFSCFRAGGPEMETVAAARAFELLGQLENQVRKTDTHLGGIVQWCFLKELASEGSTDPEILAAGRLSTIAAQFEARARVINN